MRLPDSGFPRFWWGIMMPLFAGVGIWTVLDWIFPEAWLLPITIIIAAGLSAWAWRQAQWAKRQAEAIERDMARWRERVKH